MALVLLANFFLLELLLLVFNDQIFSHAFYVFDPDLGFRVRPYARYGNEQANEFGFNDRDYPHQPPPGRFRILVLSDSFNWMGGQHCNYTALLEKKLEEFLGGPRVEVIAAGYPQTHTGEQLALLKKFGLLYQPHLVILGFFAGNDFFDAHPQRLRVAYGGATTDVYRDRDWYAVVFGQPLLLRSRLLLLLEQQWQLWRRGKGPLNQPEPAGREVDCRRIMEGQGLGLPREEYLRLVYLRMRFADRRLAEHFRPYEETIYRALEEMQRLLQARGIGLLVAAFPDEAQVDPQLRAELVQRYNLEEAEFEWDRAQRLLAAFCRRQGIDFTDLLLPFRKASEQGTVLYLPNDSHWNLAGNELAARILLQELQSRSLLPSAGDHHGSGESP